MENKTNEIYRGKAKIVYNTANADHVIIEYTDQATAFNGVKKENIAEKGHLNADITSHIYRYLESKGIPTHFIDAQDKEILAKKLNIILVEVVVRNIVAGSLSERLGLPEGTPLKKSVIEFYYKSDELNDPMINEYHIDSLGLATPAQMDKIKELAWKINDILREYFSEIGIDLVDFKLEFGDHNGEVLLGDEISPDTCRFWDKSTGEKLDKDRFRRDLGGVGDAYRQVLDRLRGQA